MRSSASRREGSVNITKSTVLAVCILTTGVAHAADPKSKHPNQEAVATLTSLLPEKANGVTPAHRAKADATLSMLASEATHIGDLKTAAKTLAAHANAGTLRVQPTHAFDPNAARGKGAHPTGIKLSAPDGTSVILSTTSQFHRSDVGHPIATVNVPNGGNRHTLRLRSTRIVPGLGVPIKQGAALMPRANLRGRGR
jgi:hypothetical protein